MPHRVFISYSVEDSRLATEVCGRLEAADIGCWIAPRDVRPGSEWTEAIMEAIEATTILAVLVSRASNGSEFVQRELECATSLKKLILPIRLDREPLSASLRFLLSSSHWMSIHDGGVEQHGAAITDAVRAMLAQRPSAPRAPDREQEETRPASVRPPLLQAAKPHPGAVDVVSRWLGTRAGKLGATIVTLLVVAVVAFAMRRWIDSTLQLVMGSQTGTTKPPVRPPDREPPPRIDDASTVDAHPKPEAPLITNSLGMKLVRIAPGTFRMGSPEGEPYREEIENSFDCTISKAFYMGATEVTRGQFQAFVDATGYITDAERSGFSDRWTAEGWEQVRGHSWKSAVFGQTARHPVVDVSWTDAAAFCEWLSKQESARYSLPTEAQWEYCYRAGSTTIWPWGTTPEEAQQEGNAADIAAKGADDGLVNYFPFDDGYVASAPVASFKPNPWGIYDMFGNVREWCMDWYWDYPGSAATDPAGSRPAKWRMVRGSSFGNSPAASRSANRARTPAAVPSAQHIGFRVVMLKPE